MITIVVIPVIALRFDDPMTATQGSVLQKLLLIYAVAAALCFIVSTLTGNYSQVDKLWSIMPLIYTWIVAAEGGFEPRLVLMAVLVSAWGVRLSYNFWRRGGYTIRFWTGEEDYRWAILRSRPEFAARWKWVLFNLLFISFYQMGLILLMTVPAVRSMGAGPLSVWDMAMAALLLFFIVIETVADQQQWNYHKTKRMWLEKGGDIPEKFRKGFVDTGMWGLVRHPNYAAEQAIWIVFYLFSVAATGQWINWSVMGAILLVLLFRGSSNFSESISEGKYPEYAGYQKRVPRFVPVPWQGVPAGEGKPDPVK